MCDDFNDEFDSDFDGEPEDYGDDSICDDDFEDSRPTDDGDPTPESDEFTAQDTFILGGAMGLAYEEGFRDAIQLKRKKKTKKRRT